MTESDARRAANLEFYYAFTTRDLEAMDRLWARKAQVLCTLRAGYRSPAGARSWRGGKALSPIPKQLR